MNTRLGNFVLTRILVSNHHHCIFDNHAKKFPLTINHLNRCHSQEISTLKIPKNSDGVVEYPKQVQKNRARTGSKKKNTQGN